MLALLVAGVLTFAAAGAGLYFALQPTVLRIAVGPDDSDDARVVRALAATFERERNGIRLLPTVTDGGAESIALLAQGKADLAIGRGDLSMPSDAQSAAIMRKNVVVLWAPARPAKEGARTAPKVKELSDLAGRKVGLIGRSGANAEMLGVILKESGVDPAKVTTVSFAVSALAEMAKDASLSAYMAVGPVNSRITAEAIAATAKTRGEPVFLGIDVGDAIAQRHPIYESEEIPQAAFSASPARPSEKVDTIEVNHLIVARRQLSETTVGNFVRQLFAVRQALQRELPGMAKIETPDTDKDAAIPAHAGAAAYLEGTERTFLEKYSDFLWAGLFVVSGLGSAAAWFRGYLRRNEREGALALRKRLLAMTADDGLRSADGIAALRIEADALLREALVRYDDGAIGPDDLSAFGLALEHFDRVAGAAELRLDRGPRPDRVSVPARAGRRWRSGRLRWRGP